MVSGFAMTCALLELLVVLGTIVLVPAWQLLQYSCWLDVSSCQFLLPFMVAWCPLTGSLVELLLVLGIGLGIFVLVLAW